MTKHSDSNKIKFLDFFNPYSVKHLLAWKYLQQKGHWPVDFIPANVEFESSWQIIVLNKFAIAWMDAAEEGHLPDIPAFEDQDYQFEKPLLDYSDVIEPTGESDPHSFVYQIDLVREISDLFGDRTDNLTTAQFLREQNVIKPINKTTTSSVDLFCLRTYSKSSMMAFIGRFNSWAIMQREEREEAHD